VHRQIGRYTGRQETSDLCLDVTPVYTVRSYILPRISEYPFSCWRCVIGDVVSKNASQYILEKDDDEE
jgi:hypothetical protein